MAPGAKPWSVPAAALPATLLVLAVILAAEPAATAAAERAHLCMLPRECDWRSYLACKVVPGCTVETSKCCQALYDMKQRGDPCANCALLRQLPLDLAARCTNGVEQAAKECDELCKKDDHCY